jgi:hypothetical protein
MAKRKRVLWWGSALVVLAGLGLLGVRWLTTYNDRVTREALARVEAGMRLAQAEALFGGPAQDPSISPLAIGSGGRHLIFLDVGDGIIPEVEIKTFGARTFLASPNQGERKGSWRTWQGRQNGNALIAAVYFDAQGRAQKTVGYELEEPGFFTRLRLWLGL